MSGIHLCKVQKNYGRLKVSICIYICLFDIIFLNKTYFFIIVLDAWGKIPSGFLSSHIDNFGDYDECVKIKHPHIKSKYCLAKFPINFSLIDKLEKQPFEIVDGKNENLYVKFYSHFNLTKEQKIFNPLLFHTFLYSIRLIYLKNENFVFYTSGICFPKSCSSKEISKLFKMVFKIKGLKQNVTINESECSTNDPIIWTARDQIALYVLHFYDSLSVKQFNNVHSFKKNYNRQNHAYLCIFRILFIVIGILVTLSTIYDIITRYYKKS